MTLLRWLVYGSLLVVGSVVWSANLVPNGDFEAVDSAGMPENWAARAWSVEPLGKAGTQLGGVRGKRRLDITVGAGKAVYGCFCRAMDISGLQQKRLLVSYSYRTKEDPHAQAMLVYFAEDFMKAQWETRPLTEEARGMRPSSAWKTSTWHATLPPGAKQAVLVFQVLSQGTLSVDNVVVRPSPDELEWETQDVGMVAALPTTRRAAVRLTSRSAAVTQAKLTLTALRDGRPANVVTRDLRLEPGKPQELDLRYNMPAREAHEVELAVTEGSSGDLALYERRQVPGLVAAVMETPAFRGTIMASHVTPEIVVSGRVFAVPGLMGQVKLVARLTGTGAQATEGSGVIRQPDGTFRVTLPSEGLLIGNHEVRVEARVGKETVAAAVLPVHRTRPRDSEVTYDSEHRLWVKGQAQFPLGIYYILSTDDLDAVAAAGFNVAVVPYAKASYVLAQRAAAKGVGLIVASANTQRDFWERAEDKFGNDPALVGWELIQRPDAKLILPDIVRALYEIVSEVSPVHPIITTLRYPEVMTAYAAATDILVPWEFPVPRMPLTRLADLVDAAQAATAGHKPVWALIQATGNAWATDRTLDPKTDGRLPTMEEVRALAYLALVHGADGLLYYAYNIIQNEKQANFKLPQDAPDIWQGLAALNKEIATLAPILGRRSQRRVLPAVANGLVHMALWQSPEQTLVIAVNTADLPTVTTFSIPDSLATQAQVPFEGRNLVTEKPGCFGDVFQPYQTHVYVLPKQ